jgi:putative hemolysin
MKTISMMATAAAIAISALSFTATPGAAKTAKVGPATPAEHYCLSYEAGSECGFTSYTQCEAMASGIGGDCRPEAGAGDRTREQPAHG